MLGRLWMWLRGYRRVGEVRLDVIRADGSREEGVRVIPLWARRFRIGRQ